MDDFSVFTLSWSARYRRFHTAAPTSSGPSVSPVGDKEEEDGCVEEVGISAISGGGGIKQQELYFMTDIYEIDDSDILVTPDNKFKSDNS